MCRTLLPFQWFWSKAQSDEGIVSKVIRCWLQRSASRLPLRTLACALRNSALCACSAAVMPGAPRLLPAERTASWYFAVCLYRRMLRAGTVQPFQDCNGVFLQGVSTLLCSRRANNYRNMRVSKVPWR